MDRRKRSEINLTRQPSIKYRIASSDYKIMAKTINGVARLLEGEEAKAANRLLRKKYGFKYTFFNAVLGVSERGKKLFYEIIPKGLPN